MFKFAIVSAVALLLANAEAGAATVFPNTNLRTCGALWRAIGLVEHVNARNRATTFLCYKRFALRYDHVSKTPEWVIERIRGERDLCPNLSRPEGVSFKVETKLPQAARSNSDDYTNPSSPLNRGHMAPSEDFRNRRADMIASFVFSNMVPQIGTFNQRIWGELEKQVRNVAVARGDIHIITGPVHRDGGNRTRTISATDAGCGHRIPLEGPPKAFICRDRQRDSGSCLKGVGVPIGVFKIVYDSRNSQVYAFLMPNTANEIGSEEPRAYLDKYRVTVAAIESVTGLRFFLNLPAETRTRVINTCQTEPFWAPEPRVCPR